MAAAGEPMLGMTLGISDPEFGQRPMPEWAIFLINLGWRLGSSPQSNGKRFSVLTVPTRTCASALCALGVLGASASAPLPALTFKELQELRPGSRVFFVDERPQNGPILEWTVLPGNNQGGYSLRSGKYIIRIYEGDFPRIRLYSQAVARPPKQARLRTIADFYSCLVPASAPYWVYLARLECAIVTNRARWARDLNGIGLYAESPDGSSAAVELSTALMSSDDIDANFVRLLLSSRGDRQPDLNPDVPVILDGPDAFRCHSLLKTRRLLVLLENREWDEAIEQELVELFCSREDHLLPTAPGASEFQLPPGCDFTEFALPEEGP